jgi:signal transduction histidine kinase
MGPVIATTSQLSRSVFAGTAPLPHVAAFYDELAALERALLRFVSDGLAADRTVVVMARPTRLAALASGQWPAAARFGQHLERGELLLVNADEVLDRLLELGPVDARGFATHVSHVLDAARARTGRPVLRVFGELGDILVARRRFDDAVALTSLWNHEVTRAPTEHLTAYALDAFVGDVGTAALDRLCRLVPSTVLCPDTSFESITADVWAVIARQRDAERRRLADALVAAERRAQAGMLALGVAHDLNNLLQPILQAGEELASLATSVPAERAARQVVHTAHEAAELVRAMMRVSRPASATTPVSLHRVAATALTLLRSRLQGVRVKLEVDASLPAVAAHESSLLQVLLNLLLNAREALPESGGQITVALDRCAPGASGDDWVRVSVIDTGLGMDAATKDRLFEPFFTTKPQGNGIGLAAVRTLLEAMGGRIDVHSTVGRGSVFAVRLRASPLAT